MNLKPIDAKAPITAVQRKRLEADATNIRACAKRKRLDLTEYDYHEESIAARQHFELGCWLWHYARKFQKNGGELLERIDCARRIFEAGIQNPRYTLYTVFDFGERQFDSLFEMGDGKAVVEGLRQYVNSSVNVRKAFEHNNWPIEGAQICLAL